MNLKIYIHTISNLASFNLSYLTRCYNQKNMLPSQVVLTLKLIIVNFFNFFSIYMLEIEAREYVQLKLYNEKLL
jgi:flagellar assembly factor FliW